jgi:hypothetical protein
MPPTLRIAILFFLVVLGFERKASLSQALHHLSHSTNPVLGWVFSK